MQIVHESSDDDLAFDLLAHAQAVVRARVRELREEAGLSQAAAAGRLGRKQWHWSRIENGGTDLKLDHLLEVQAALRLPSIEVLFGTLPSVILGKGRVPDEPERASEDFRPKKSPAKSP
jgi:transcriptional regulator with XRE-family HTH domain